MPATSPQCHEHAGSAIGGPRVRRALPGSTGACGSDPLTAPAATGSSRRRSASSNYGPAQLGQAHVNSMAPAAAAAAAFLRHGDPLLREGIFVWIPERACGQLFDGFLRPDALAGIRVADRAVMMFIERDLGTERGEVLGEKIRRYRSVFARALDVPIHVGFVVESDRRAHTVHGLVTGRNTPGSGVRFLTAVAAGPDSPVP